MTERPQIARVAMPERGVFMARIADGVEVSVGSDVLVSLDYGEDIGEVRQVADYDPAQHGLRPPSFQVLRLKTPDDDTVIAENERLAQDIARTFLKVVDVPDMKIVRSRLAFGRSRLFLHVVSPSSRPDMTAAQGEVKRRFGVSVNVWQAGPRDIVGLMGAAGPCGRTCCCASWQRKYPVFRGTDRRFAQNPMAVNGMCGRYKCCLSFEEVDNGKENTASERTKPGPAGDA